MNTKKQIELRNIYSETTDNSIYTDNITVDFFPESGGIMIIKSCTWGKQDMQKNNECDIIQLKKEQATQIALSILKSAGILPEVTTIAELEKQGKL